MAEDKKNRWDLIRLFSPVVGKQGSRTAILGESDFCQTETDLSKSSSALECPHLLIHKMGNMHSMQILRFIDYFLDWTLSFFHTCKVSKTNGLF